MTPSEVVKTWFERVWNQGDGSFIDEALATECSVTGLDTQTISCPGDFYSFHEKLNAAFSDMLIIIDRIMECDDEVSGIVTVNATHRGTGKHVAFQSSFFSAIREGKIIEAENLIDYFGLLAQLEQLNPEVLTDALS